ncbi:pyrroloquinoline-quinone synthase PqqC [Streptomyces sp. S1A1-7]|nr:pyrroloquinoline-quinone synthase PqqC [Streptomyces sp. S1A1-7]
MTATPVRDDGAAAPWGTAEFTERLRAIAEDRYHDRHPFNVRMHQGELTPAELRRWIINRFHYQRHIPVKDALILAKFDDPALRRVWVRRIQDHDGTAVGRGGIERWLRLGEAAGLERPALWDTARVLPGVRLAVEGYVNFCRLRPVLDAVAASLTELSAPGLMRTRIAAFERYYPWIEAAGLAYFRTRIGQGGRDSEEALALVQGWARTREQQERAVAALTFKCEVLWALLDAVDRASDSGPTGTSDRVSGGTPRGDPAAAPDTLTRASGRGRRGGSGRGSDQLPNALGGVAGDALPLAAEDAPGDVSGLASGRVPGDVLPFVPEGAPGDVSGLGSERVPGDVLSLVSEGVPGGASPRVSEHVPGDVSGLGSERVPGDVLSLVSEGVPGGASPRVSEHLPGDVSPLVSESASGDVSTGGASPGLSDSVATPRGREPAQGCPRAARDAVGGDVASGASGAAAQARTSGGSMPTKIPGRHPGAPAQTGTPVVPGPAGGPP